VPRVDGQSTIACERLGPRSLAAGVCLPAAAAAAAVADGFRTGIASRTTTNKGFFFYPPASPPLKRG